jgi:pimeloyl-ACP methyl ester carboxylesterase
MAAARRHADDLRGATRLAAEATRGITELVEAMHRTIASGPLILGEPLTKPAHILTKIAYAPTHGVTALIAGGLDAALRRLEPLLGESVPGKEREAIVAALNGVLGDHLEATGNPLALPMTLHPPRIRGRKLLVALHGSSMNRHAWQSRRGHDHAAALAGDLGYEAVYVDYNSGRHVSTNGRELAARLAALAEQSHPSDIILLGHSMGGLVARSAALYAERDGLAWRSHLRALVTLGTPHHGAPLERGGNWVDTLLGVHRYSAPLARLGKIRSAGVTDLRHGMVQDADWEGRDRFALGRDERTPASLPADVACFAVAATLSRAPAMRLRSDGLVPVASAFGDHPRAELGLRVPEAHRFLAFGTSHLDLLERADVYERLREWLSGVTNVDSSGGESPGTMTKPD